MVPVLIVPSILWMAVFGSALLLLLVRTVTVMIHIRRRRDTSQRHNNVVTKRIKPVKTVIVLGSGGHTTEMLDMIKNLSPSNYSPLIFVVASTDDTSERRLVAVMGETILSSSKIYKIPRSREVGQSYVTSVWTTLWSFVHALTLTSRLRPGLLLCNGPGTCLPIAISTLFWRIIGWCPGNIVFVESFCRVET
jgi:beta-1,4-N-acetylglucosaminyltransferase